MRKPTAVLEAGLWQAYAHLYDGLLDVYAYRDMLDDVVELSDVKGHRVLDVGCGTGNVTARLLQDRPAHVVAVDASANMLGLARRKLALDVAQGSVEFVLDDATAALAAQPEGSVDRITAVNFLYTQPDRTAFFTQVARVLAPGGFLVAAHTTRPGFGPIVREQLRRGGWRSLLRVRLIGIGVIDLLIDLLARGGRYDFSPVDRLADEAAAAGLGTTTRHGRTYGGPDDGVNELVRIGR
ncbi:class I SAM-dependent methyltransferase [Spongisporangium articulatum]|uniref:Class I SAM-dependent methyltransferase n=1 Tax=Spongisporangium articulatum TaxID=3362603 RepID=A0ABW8ATU6_9ACTN